MQENDIINEAAVEAGTQRPRIFPRPARRTRVAVLFGSRSVEHEISVISGLQLMRVVDVTRFDVVPIYIAHSGRFYTGDRLRERSFYAGGKLRLDLVDEVTLPPSPGKGFLKVPRTFAERLKFALQPDTQLVPVDLCIPVFHGEYGEDGCIQGLLELADLPYTGGGVLSSALAMNKYLCKSVLAQHDIPVLPGVRVLRSDFQRDPEQFRLDLTSHPDLTQFPLFIKPVNLGSSVGVSKVETEADLLPALIKVFVYDTEAIIEPCVVNIVEINVSVMDYEGATASVVEIPYASGGFLSYEDKYLRDDGSKKSGGGSQGMASLTRVIDPPQLDPAIKQTVTTFAKKAFRVLGCSGTVRFDFIMDAARNQIYFNELNSIPGSLAFYLWAKSHPPLLYTEEVSRMIEAALRRKGERLALERSTGFRALK